MIVKFYDPAPPGTVFTQDALDRLIGTSAPLTLAGVQVGMATILGVEVDGDGRGATWTIEEEEQVNGQSRT